MDYTTAINSANTVLVEFFASWCIHCQRMMPIVEQVKETLAGKVPVFQFDVDKYQELSEQEGVQSYPTFILYVGGKEVWRQTGEMPGDKLLATVESYMK